MPEISEQNWNAFAAENNGSFLQSYEWGQFQKSLGKKALFLKENTWQALLIVNPLPFGKTYFYAPRGPVWDLKKESAVSTIEDFLIKVKPEATKHKAIFVKIEPETENMNVAHALEKSGFIKSPKSIQPSNTLIIDLTAPENEIFQSFEKQCRYEINKAEKKEVKIYSASSDNAVNDFLSLLAKTTARDSFRAHSENYYRKMAETLRASGKIDIFFAKMNEEIISACVVVYFGTTASYIHAASHGSYRAANALVWAAMREAKKKNYLYFDMYGVSPANAPENHPWRGLTKFKESFGGRRVNYIGAYDYAFSDFWTNLYKIYKLHI